MPHRADTVPIVTAERLLALVQAFRGRRVAVIGDLLADEFIYGRVERVSREAPVLILRYDQTIVVPGGAGNAASNAAALGGQVALAAIVGQDGAGKRLVGESRARDQSSIAGSGRRIRHAAQDADSRRRHPLGQAAGRSHRPHPLGRAQCRSSRAHSAGRRRTPSRMPTPS